MENVELLEGDGRRSFIRRAFSGIAFWVIGNSNGSCNGMVMTTSNNSGDTKGSAVPDWAGQVIATYTYDKNGVLVCVDPNELSPIPGSGFTMPADPQDAQQNPPQHNSRA